MITTEIPKYLEKSLSQCHMVHNNSQMALHLTRAQYREAGHLPPQPGTAQLM